MRACFRGAVVLLLLVSAVGVADAACEPMTAFIEQLKAGKRAAELPDPASCDEDFAPDLARALAAYVQGRPPADVEAVVASIKGGYHKAERKTAFGKLAAAVQHELASTGFTLPETEDKYALLDTLPRYAKPSPVRATAPPPKPVAPAVTAPPPAAPSSADRRPPPRISPLAGVIALWIVCSIAGAALLAYVLIGRRRSLVQQATIDRHLQELAASSADDKTALAALEMKLGRVETAQQGAAEQLRTWSERFPADASILSPRHLDGVSAAIRELRDQVGRLENGHKNAAAAPGPADSVALERQALGESWKKFRQNEELRAYFDSATNDECWKQIGDPLLSHLPKLVPDDLKPTFEAVLAPAREYNNLVAKISVIPRIVSGDVPRLENDAQELMRMREFAQLLAMSHNSSFVTDRLNFRLKSWVMDNFLTFADLYLQRYQQARMENREGTLEEGMSIVKRILRVAAVEPIDVTLGETPFDSTRHIGRSTTSDARYSDGVIVGVVRNGFLEGGKQVIRQPEVVVNRTR